MLTFTLAVATELEAFAFLYAILAQTTAFVRMILKH